METKQDEDLTLWVEDDGQEELLTDIPSWDTFDEIRELLLSVRVECWVTYVH